MKTGKEFPSMKQESSLLSNSRGKKEWKTRAWKTRKSGQ